MREMICAAFRTIPAGRDSSGAVVIAAIVALMMGAGGAAQVDQPPGDVKSKAIHKHTNALIRATSPYLLQHAHNPVDWREWSPETLAEAQRRDVPIFLSIGYSACHWCHVMEHESFEDEGIAALLNEHFIAIKVDREERPDIDAVYMQATVAMTGHGGWPMSVFATPTGEPFFCGTYFPRDGFAQILTRVTDAWRDQRPDLLEQGSRLRSYLKDWASGPKPAEGVIGADLPTSTARRLAEFFDERLGGMRSDQNKFPPSMSMELMLRTYIRSGEKRLLKAVETTLDHMARGGIYDHLGGGICRYSTDPKWLVPHFEKMLYDQALVSAIYLDAFQLTRNPLYEQTARGILDYVLADLQSPEGGFYSTRDADSEGMEGKYYIWTVEQVGEVLGKADAELFCAYYDVTETGNWFESLGHAPAGPKNILNVQRSVETVAKLHDLDPPDLERRLARMREKMLTARSRRVPPSLDDKILTGWNGLMIASLAKGACVLDEPRYAQAAARAADFILKKLRNNDGSLLRTYRDGRARLTGYLSDYAFCVEGLINLYEADFDPRWIRQATGLTDDMIRRYADDEGGAFFFTADDGEKLLVRAKDPHDGAIPSGNSVAALNLLRLSLLTGRRDYRERAESIFRAFAPLVEKTPGQFDRLLCAVDFYHGEPKEIALADDAANGVRAFLRIVHQTYRPNRVLAVLTHAASADVVAEAVPLLRGKRPIDGKAAAYVCRNFVCRKPVADPAALAALLNAE